MIYECICMFIIYELLTNVHHIKFISLLMLGLCSPINMQFNFF